MKMCEVKARLRAVLQITSAQQHAPIHFILPHLNYTEPEVQRTGEGSTKLVAHLHDYVHR